MLQLKRMYDLSIHNFKAEQKCPTPAKDSYHQAFLSKPTKQEVWVLNSENKMADAVTATLTQRNGECKEYREVLTKATGQEGSKLDGLIKSLTKIQKEVNESLTELVEVERGTVHTNKHDQGSFFIHYITYLT